MFYKPSTYRAFRNDKVRAYQGTIFLIAVGALVLRLIHISQLFYSPISDMTSYLTMMEDVFGGRNPSSPYSTMFPPGYPAFLFVVTKVFGLVTLKPVLVIQAVVDAATVMLAAAVCRSLFNAKAAVIGSIAFAFYKYQILNCGLLLTESLSMDAVVWILWLLTRYDRRRSWGRAVGLGILVAAATHLRTNIAPVLLPLAFHMTYPMKRCGFRSDWRKATRLLLKPSIMALLAVVLLIPWSWRNSVISKRPTFVADNAGMNMLQGNNPISQGGWVVMTEIPDPYGKPTRVSGTEGLRQMGEMGKKFVSEYLPYVVFYIWPERIKRLFLTDQMQYPWESGYGGEFWTHPFGPYVRVPLIYFQPVLVLGLIGFLVRGRRMPYLLVFTWAILVIPLMIPPANIRYRYVSDPPLLLALSAPLAAMVSEIQKRMKVRYLVFAYVAFCGIASLTAILRLGGPNLASKPDRWFTRSAALEAITTGTLRHDSVKEKTAHALVIPLGEMRVRPWEESHLMLSFQYKLNLQESPGNSQTPNIRITYFDASGKQVTKPVAAPLALNGYMAVNKYQERGDTAWRILNVPALARKVRFEVVSNLMAVTELSELQIRGAIWAHN